MEANNTGTKDHDLLIALNSKVDAMLEKFEKLDSFETRMRAIEVSDGVNKNNISTMGNEVEKLRNTSNIWSSILTVLTSLGIALGVLGR